MNRFDFFLKLSEELRALDSGLWQAKHGIACCYVQPDEVEHRGLQGIELFSCLEAGISFSAYAEKAFAASQADLNLPVGLSDQARADARAAYLQHGGRLVCGAAVDPMDALYGFCEHQSWHDTFCTQATLNWIHLKEGVIDYPATAMALKARATALLAPWEIEMHLTTRMLNRLAGWTDENDHPCEPGRPAGCAAWICPDVTESRALEPLLV